MAPLFTVRSYGIHTAKVLAQDYLTLGPMYPWTYPAVIISVPECIIGMDKLSRSQDLHIDSLTHGLRADRKAEKKPPSITVLKTNEHHTLGRMAEIRAIPKDLNEARVMVPTIPPFKSPI